jgi:hypothetical protein
VNPLSRDKDFLNRLLSSHPPIEERIERLADMGGVTPSILQKAKKEGEALALIPLHAKNSKFQ